jgi:hypothetical protein
MKSLIPRTQPRRWRSYRSDLECPCCICVAWSEKEEFPTGDRHPRFVVWARVLNLQGFVTVTPRASRVIGRGLAVARNRLVTKAANLVGSPGTGPDGVSLDDKEKRACLRNGHAVNFGRQVANREFRRDCFPATSDKL